MMGTEIFKIDASWAEKLTKTRVSFLMTPTVSRLDFSLQFGFMRDQLLFGSISFLFNVPNSGVHFIIYVIIIHSNAPGKDQVFNYASIEHGNNSMISEIYFTVAM